MLDWWFYWLFPNLTSYGYCTLNKQNIKIHLKLIKHNKTKIIIITIIIIIPLILTKRTNYFVLPMILCLITFLNGRRRAAVIVSLSSLILICRSIVGSPHACVIVSSVALLSVNGRTSKNIPTHCLYKVRFI